MPSQVAIFIVVLSSFDWRGCPPRVEGERKKELRVGLKLREEAHFLYGESTDVDS